MALFLSSALPLSFHVILNYLNWWGQKTLLSLQYSSRQELDGVLERIWMLVGPLARLDVPKTVPIATNGNVTMIPRMYLTLDDGLCLWPYPALGRSSPIIISLLLSGIWGSQVGRSY